VLVNNGETVVLGGVVEQNKASNQDKVPLLGDIPLLGYLFQRNANNVTKRELLIFVTPQILKEGRVAE
jgi:type IV pilus assembly protein PilQ